MDPLGESRECVGDLLVGYEEHPRWSRRTEEEIRPLKLNKTSGILVIKP